jgi:hypothetical protein
MYQYQLPSTITAHTILPVTSIRLFLREPLKNVLALVILGSRDGIHFSSSVGLAMDLSRDRDVVIALLLLFKSFGVGSYVAYI